MGPGANCSRVRWSFLILLLLSGTVWAQEVKPLKVVSVEAWADGYVKRPIQVTVKVQNTNREPISGTIKLLLVPQAGGPRKQGEPAGVLDPTELTELVQDLPPGQTATVLFHTRYLAAGNFKNRIGFFTAIHPISAMGHEVRVAYRVLSEL